MDASILDLRYKMNEVLKALNRREKVRILYHGKIKGEIIPSKSDVDIKTVDHPIFGLTKNERENPSQIVANLRRRRMNAV